MPGRLYHSPARVLQQFLVDVGLASDPRDGVTVGGGVTYGDWPVFRGREPDRPDNLLKLSDTSPRSDGDTQVDGERQEHEGVQVFVRSADYDTGWLKLNDVCLELNAVARQFTSVELFGELGTAGAVYQITACTKVSGPGPTGPDTPQGKRLTFTANYLVSVRMCGV